MLDVQYRISFLERNIIYGTKEQPRRIQEILHFGIDLQLIGEID